MKEKSTVAVEIPGTVSLVTPLLHLLPNVTPSPTCNTCCIRASVIKKVISFFLEHFYYEKTDYNLGPALCFFDRLLLLK
jgi:hypothetical protein